VREEKEMEVNGIREGRSRRDGVVTFRDREGGVSLY